MVSWYMSVRSALEPARCSSVVLMYKWLSDDALPQDTLNDVLSQFDVPIGHVQKMFPTVVLDAQIDLHKRTPLGPLGLAYQVHGGFLGGAVGLLRVAAYARANDVLPSRRAAAVARDDVIEIQVLALKNVSAVLT